MALFHGFQRRRIRTSGATIKLVTAGRGEPVLLAARVPTDGTPCGTGLPHDLRTCIIVCADLRGYGDSSRPRAAGSFELLQACDGPRHGRGADSIRTEGSQK